jgi:hypothetical protein
MRFKINERERTAIMTRSIFDPTGRETERSGSTFGSESADNRSKLPADVSDGKTSPEESVEQATDAPPGSLEGTGPEEER